MATEGIQISLDQVDATAAKISSLNKSLSDQLDAVNKAVQQLNESVWNSDAAGEFRQKFQTFTGLIQPHHEVIESYATFLKDTVQSYRINEDDIKSHASAIN